MTLAAHPCSGHRSCHCRRHLAYRPSEPLLLLTVLLLRVLALGLAGRPLGLEGGEALWLPVPKGLRLWSSVLAPVAPPSGRCAVWALLLLLRELRKALRERVRPAGRGGSSSRPGWMLNLGDPRDSSEDTICRLLVEQTAGKGRRPHYTPASSLRDQARRRLTNRQSSLCECPRSRWQDP